jgi:hypothetical protein
MRIIKHLLYVLLISTVFSCAALAAENAVTPPPGDPIRKNILDVLRQKVKKIHGLDVVFVVKHLKVKDGWAWVHVLPQSPDGKNRYEDISALLQLEWKVAEIPCSDGGDSECSAGADYFKELQKQYPEVSAELFPGSITNLE